MALTKPTTFRGLSVPNGYYKIQEVKTQEATSDEQGNKIYSVSLMIGFYADETKENLLEQTEVKIQGFNEADLNYTNYYLKIKELEEFKQATDLI